MEEDKPKQERIKGKKGVPQKDRVQDVSFFVDEYMESGKKVRLGHAKMAHQTNNALARISDELKVSKSSLVRRTLESFVKFYDEAKAVGGERFFDVEKTHDAWLQERYQMAQLLNSMLQSDALMREKSKNPEVIMLSQQLTLLSKMINQTHKKLL